MCAGVPHWHTDEMSTCCTNLPKTEEWRQSEYRGRRIINAYASELHRTTPPWCRCNLDFIVSRVVLLQLCLRRAVRLLRLFEHLNTNALFCRKCEGVVSGLTDTVELYSSHCRE